MRYYALVFTAALAAAQPRTANVNLSFADTPVQLNIQRMALGQGGLSEDTIWGDRMVEVRALRPQIIRLFIQEYFDLLPAQGQYHFEHARPIGGSHPEDGRQTADDDRVQAEGAVPEGRSGHRRRRTIGASGKR